MKNNILILVFLCFVIVGCKKSSESKDEPIIQLPVMLNSPLDNSVCLEGNIVSDNHTNVPFSWGSVDKVSSYKIIITNLINGEEISKEANSASIAVQLERGKPYKWQVEYQDLKNNMQKSDVRKFYVANAPNLFYAPFPADNLSPKMGQILASTSKIVLSWIAENLNNEMNVFDIYMGTAANSLQLFKANYTSNSLEVDVNNQTHYYWKVVVKDIKGLASSTQVYNFKIQ